MSYSIALQVATQFLLFWYPMMLLLFAIYLVKVYIFD